MAMGKREADDAPRGGSRTPSHIVPAHVVPVRRDDADCCTALDVAHSISVFILLIWPASMRALSARNWWSLPA